jgi:hypothetical protein
MKVMANFIPFDDSTDRGWQVFKNPDGSVCFLYRKRIGHSWLFGKPILLPRPLAQKVLKEEIFEESK